MQAMPPSWSRFGMHGPDLAGKAQSARALDGDLAFMAANEGDGFGREKAGEGCGHGVS